MDRAALKIKRHSRKLKYRPLALNLVSMMDIFTILLLFLITMSGNENILPSPTNLVLPKSTSNSMPTPTVSIMITKDYILVAGKRVDQVSSVRDSKELLIQSIKDALELEVTKGKFISSQNRDVEFEGKVTILADKNIPFKVIKKVMFTATKANFPHISLAVIHKD